MSGLGERRVLDEGDEGLRLQGRSEAERSGAERMDGPGG